MSIRPRILMSEVDASSGNGAVVPSVVNPPSESAAPVPTAPAGGVDVDAIATKVRDSLFAELRRAGMFEKQKPAPAPAKSGESPSANAQPDPLKLRSLDRALTKSGLATRLSDSQYQRAEKAFAAEDPPDVEGWVRDYFDGFGAPNPSPVTQPAPQPAQPLNARPASDRGSPPPPQVPLYEQKLRDLSEADRNALLKEKGPQWYRTKLAADLKGQPIKLR